MVIDVFGWNVAVSTEVKLLKCLIWVLEHSVDCWDYYELEHLLASGIFSFDLSRCSRAIPFLEKNFDSNWKKVMDKTVYLPSKSEARFWSRGDTNLIGVSWSTVFKADFMLIIGCNCLDSVVISGNYFLFDLALKFDWDLLERTGFRAYWLLLFFL